MSEPSNDPIVKSEEEILQELLSSDLAIQQLDTQIIEKTNRKLGHKTKHIQQRQTLIKERTEALRNVTKSARTLADILIKIETVTLLIHRQPDLAALRHERKKRLKILTMKARDMKEEAAKKASREYYLKAMGHKKVAPPESKVTTTETP